MGPESSALQRDARRLSTFFFFFFLLLLSDQSFVLGLFNFPESVFLLSLVNRTASKVIYNKLVFVFWRVLKVFASSFCFFAPQGGKSLYSDLLSVLFMKGYLVKDTGTGEDLFKRIVTCGFVCFGTLLRKEGVIHNQKKALLNTGHNNTNTETSIITLAPKTACPLIILWAGQCMGLQSSGMDGQSYL